MKCNYCSEPFKDGEQFYIVQSAVYYEANNGYTLNDGDPEYFHPCCLTESGLNV